MPRKQNILNLYRRCIRSARAIRDGGQQIAYLNYVNDGFRRKAHLPKNSREAILAYQDGIDQVTDMEYYQQMARTRQGSRSKAGVQARLDETSTEATIKIQPSSSYPSQSEVCRWLTSQLPHLHQEDAAKYSEYLINDGFDSVDFIEEELLEDDLVFMKKAHKRVLMRQLEERRK